MLSQRGHPVPWSCIRLGTFPNHMVLAVKEKCGYRIWLCDFITGIETSIDLIFHRSCQLAFHKEFQKSSVLNHEAEII